MCRRIVRYFLNIRYILFCDSCILNAARKRKEKIERILNNQFASEGGNYSLTRSLGSYRNRNALVVVKCTLLLCPIKLCSKYGIYNRPAVIIE